MKHEIRPVAKRIGCVNCLWVADSELVLYRLFPECKAPVKKATRHPEIFRLEYGHHQDRKIPSKLWHAVCNDFVLCRSDRSYYCLCREYQWKEISYERWEVFIRRNMPTTWKLVVKWQDMTVAVQARWYSGICVSKTN